MSMSDEFSERLIELRKEKGYTQSMIAQKLGISRYAVSVMERGKNKTNIDRICILADLFDVSVDYLIGCTDDPILHKK